VVGLGVNARLGRYVTLEDSYGDRFTYSQLGSIESVYPVVKPRRESAAQIARALGGGAPPKRDAPLPAATESQPVGSASAASATSAPHPVATASAPEVAPATPTTPTALAAVPASPKERLFADPSRPASYAAGGYLQLQSSVSSYATAANLEVVGHGPSDYFAQPVRLRAHEFTLAPLTRGALVIAGTLLGRVGQDPAGSPGVTFQITPAGARAPVDPGAILAGWKVLGRLTAGRAVLAGVGHAGAYGAGNPTLGQLLMASKRQLEQDVLSDPRVAIGGCDRSAINAGLVDSRVLAVIEYLSYSGLAPQLSGLVCSRPSGFVATPGTQFDISRLDGVPVEGHQQDGGIVDLAIRRLLGLEGALRPSRIVSLRSYTSEPITLALPDHSAEIEVDFSPVSSTAKIRSAGELDTGEWNLLMGRLTRLGGQSVTTATVPTSQPVQP
jgi:hypothetical protein